MTDLNISPDWADAPLLDLFDNPQHADANRALMRAAPDLYAALLIARQWLFAAEYAGKIGGEELRRDLTTINAALRRAVGEP